MNKTKLKYDENILLYFKNNKKLLEQLKELDKKKSETKYLKEKYGNLPQPIVITLSGTPRAGKTACIDNLFEFLKKCNLKTVCLEEPAGLIYQTLKTKEDKVKLLSDRVNFVSMQYDIGDKYIKKNLQNNDIILCDRGIIDTFIWNTMYYNQGIMKESDYNNFLIKLNETKSYYNYFYALYTETFEAMKRDYLSSLSIEERTTMNKTNVENYNVAMMQILPLIEKSIDITKVIDTTNISKMDPSVIVANEILDNVKKLYLKR